VLGLLTVIAYGFPYFLEVDDGLIYDEERIVNDSLHYLIDNELCLVWITPFASYSHYVINNKG
jgi:hypothetical protein